ncbi:MAG TPA: LysR substrate-binding domain-containing protein [Dehalococcoidia bacterium]|nr:LysR substrate-binding domain-containing protein [Dehalococcoidia bacterium]
MLDASIDQALYIAMRLEQTCHQLAIFLEVVRRGSVTRAAEALVLSQPSVSAQLKTLERSLGISLFTKVGRGIQLTEGGEIVADYARRIFGLAEELAATMADLQGLATGRLIVGASTTAGEYLLPEALGRFKKLYPGIEIQLQIANTRRVVERILSVDLDLGFIGEDITDPRLVQLPYRDDELVPVVAATHPLAGRRNPPPDEVVAQGLIVRESGSATRATAARHLMVLGLAPLIIMELGSNEAIKRAVATGYGVAFLSRGSIEPECRAGLLAVVDCPALVSQRSFHIIYRRDKRLTRPEAAFLEFAQR